MVELIKKRDLQQAQLPLNDLMHLEVVSKRGKRSVLRFHDYLRFVRCHESVVAKSANLRRWAVL